MLFWALCRALRPQLLPHASPPSSPSPHPLPRPKQRHDDAHEAISPDRLERLFIYCAAWGLGGLLDVRDRAGFDAELRSFGAHMPPRRGAFLDGGACCFRMSGPCGCHKLLAHRYSLSATP